MLLRQSKLHTRKQLKSLPGTNPRRIGVYLALHYVTGQTRLASFGLSYYRNQLGVIAPILHLCQTTMASLRITNLTGTPLSFTSPSLVQDLRSRWTRVEAGEKIELALAVSSKLLKKWRKVGLRVYPTPSLTGEKSEALVEPCSASPYSLNIRRPRFRDDSSSWSIVRPTCQHIRGFRTRSSRSRVKTCSTCTEQFPWSVYVLHVCWISFLLFGL